MVNVTNTKKTLLNSEKLNFILHRLSLQIIENHRDIDNLLILGVQPRGILLCDIIHQLLEKKLNRTIHKGYIDNSLHRDDIHLQGVQAINQTQISVSLEGKDIVLIDDVLYTGRTIRATLDTIMDYGRPNDVELLALIDRRLHRNLPIEAKYVGLRIDSIDREKVIVSLSKDMKNNKVEILI